MNFKTKVFAVLLSVLLLVGIVPFGAFAAEETLQPAEFVFEGTTIRVILDADNIKAIDDQRDITAKDIKAMIPDNLNETLLDEAKVIFPQIIKDNSNYSKWLDNKSDKTEMKNLTIRVINNILGYSDDITINGVSVFNVNTGKLNAKKILEVIYDTVKDAKDISFKIVADLDDSETSEDFILNVEFNFAGEQSNIDYVRNLIKKHLDHTKYDFDGNAVTANLTVPAKASVYFTKALASDKLSDSVKTDILSVLSTNVDDAIAIVEKYLKKVSAMSVDELLDLAELIADVTDSGINLVSDTKTVAANRASAAENVRSYIEKTLNAVIDALESAPEKVTAANIDEKLYDENGVFSGKYADKISSATIFERLASINSVFEQAESYFERFDTTVDLDATVKFEDLYQVKFKVGDNIVFITYVPKGTEFATIEKYISAVAGTEWVFEDTKEAAVTVPGKDSVVIPKSGTNPPIPPKTGDADGLSAFKTAVLGYSVVAVIAVAAVALFTMKKKKENW